MRGKQIGEDKEQESDQQPMEKCTGQRHPILNARGAGLSLHRV